MNMDIDDDFNEDDERIPPPFNPRRDRERAYYEKNREEISKTKRKYRIAIRDEAVALLGGKCQRCGYSRCLSAISVVGITRGKLSYVAYWNRIYHKIKLGERFALICENCKIEEREEQ